MHGDSHGPRLWNLYPLVCFGEESHPLQGLDASFPSGIVEPDLFRFIFSILRYEGNVIMKDLTPSLKFCDPKFCASILNWVRQADGVKGRTVLRVAIHVLGGE